MQPSLEFNLRVIFGLNLYSSKRKSFEIFLAKDFPKTQVCVKVVKVKCYVNPFDWSHEVLQSSSLNDLALNLSRFSRLESLNFLWFPVEEGQEKVESPY